MFTFFDMADNYDSRKVDRFDAEWGFVSTAYVTDADKPYETAVQHKDYDTGTAIVATYDTKEEAQAGHDVWVKKMTAKHLPKTLKDVGLSGVAQIGRLLGANFDKPRIEN